MAAFHISEADAAKDFKGLIARVRAGDVVYIEDGTPSVRLTAVAPASRAPLTPRFTEPRLLSEILADMESSDSCARLDDTFSSDLVDTMRSHERERLIDPWEAF